MQAREWSGFPGVLLLVPGRPGHHGDPRLRLFHDLHRSLGSDHPGARAGSFSYALVRLNTESASGTGLLTASGSIGLLFPPSLPVIIYGVTAQISIKDMFVAGIVPGFLMVLALIRFGFFYSLKNKVDRHPFRLREALVSFKEVLLGDPAARHHRAGFISAESPRWSESAAVAVLYVWWSRVLIHRDLKSATSPMFCSNACRSSAAC